MAKKVNFKYTPILKFKEAEIWAIKNLPESIAENILPLCELVPKDTQLRIDGKTQYFPVDHGKRLHDGIHEIRKYLYNMPILLDSMYLDDISREAFFKALDGKTTLFGDKIIPVIYLSDLDELKNPEVREIFNRILTKRGGCLRIFPKKEDTDQLPRQIANFLKELSLKGANLDLLLDYEITENTEGLVDDIVNLTNSLQDLNDWNSVIVASGAVPKYLTEFSPEEIGYIERADWKIWQEVSDNLKDIEVEYADYGIRHPIFKLLRGVNTSNSIRYTGDDLWLILRGRSPKSKEYKGSIQYRALAMLLVDHDEYCGEEYSAGDLYIKSKANLDTKTGNGNSTTWLKASTNHHIHKVVEQVTQQRK